MKRFAASMVLAGGILGTLIGTAGAAHADLSDIYYMQQQQGKVYVPHVDTTVRHSRWILSVAPDSIRTCFRMAYPDRWTGLLPPSMC